MRFNKMNQDEYLPLVPQARRKVEVLAQEAVPDQQAKEREEEVMWVWEEEDEKDGGEVLRILLGQEAVLHHFVLVKD